MVPALRANALATILTFAAAAIAQVGKSFDLVHCHGFCGLRGNVLTGHICNEAWGHALSKFAGALTLLECVFHFFANGLESQLYRHARDCAVIAVSDRVARDLVECYGCLVPIHRIYHGVDLETFSPIVGGRMRLQRREALALPESEAAFLYVGDLRKSARQCIQALAQLDSGRLDFSSLVFDVRPGKS